VQPGLVRDIALAVMFIGSASTLLINGNPLLRFDGYYVLCDAFDLRNLATRSRRYWIGRLNRHVLGLNSQRFLDPLPGERGWLIAYAPLAWIYRVSLSLAIALWVGSQSEVLGVIVGATSCWSLFGAPLWSLFAHLRGSLLRETARMQLAMRIAALATVVVLLFGVVPLPFNTVAEGVVWPPDKAQLRNETEGFLASFVVPDGAQVKTGDLLIVMRDDNLAATRAGNQSDVVELESQLFQAMETDPGKVPNLNQKLEYARAQLARIEQRIEKLQIRAKTDGVVVLPHQQDLLGSFHKQGELLGYLLTNEPLTVRVALPQQDAALVRSALNKVDVRLAEYGSNTHAGRVSLDMPATVDQLPSQALGDRGGGQILTDAADKNGLKTRTSVVLMDVAVPDFRTSRIGGRALVRFDHGQLPLALQALRQLQQLVLHTFNPGS